MNSSPCVSVIVPNYNHAVYLKQRIDSILQQSYEDFELILLDDCSTDDSRQILSGYQTNPKVSHIVFNESNSGSTFKQWSKGLSLAQGTYVWIAESDDFADSHFLELVIQELKNNAKAVLAFTGSQMVNEYGDNIEKDWDHFSSAQPFQTTYTGETFLKTKMIWNNSIYNASMVVFRKEYYKKVSDTYKQFRYCGDWLFWIEMCRQGEVISIHQKLNRFRQHLEKVSVNATQEGLDFIEGCSVMQFLTDELHLSTYRRIVISGRVQKRLQGNKWVDNGLRQRIMTDYNRFFLWKKWAILVYELDKFLKLLYK